MFPQGQGAFNPVVPRTGLTRTGGTAAGPRNPAGACTADLAANNQIITVRHGRMQAE